MQQEKVIENLFRSEYGKIIAILTNRFGPSYIESIEDALQDALLKAMQVWGYASLPEHPTSWLLRVTQNGLIDKLRRDKKIVVKGGKLVDIAVIDPDETTLENTISDSQLKMVFACCHPSLSIDYQLILSLKLIGGFGNKEIAKALLKKEESVAKSFTRAKRQLKAAISTLEIPLEMGLQSRLEVVLRVIYLLFSEGYASSSGENIIKKDICLESIRLALLLNKNKFCNRPNVHALIALMCFHTARFEARIDEKGALVDLEHQDRRKYDKDLIKIGIQNLETGSKAVQSPSNYHLEAAVSYYHCVAKTFADTDWRSILYLYDLQLKRQYSPIVELNRVIPFYKVYGAKKANGQLKLFEEGPHFIKNSLYYAIKAELLLNLKANKGCKEALLNAIKLSKNLREKAHLEKKLELLVI